MTTDESSGNPATSVKPSALLPRLASGVLLLGAFAGLVLLVFAIRRFDGSLSGNALLWYVAFGLTAGALALCGLYLDRTARVNVAIACTVVTVGLYGTETALGLAARAEPSRIANQLALRTGIPVDVRTVPQLVLALRRSGVPAVPSVAPVVFLRQSGPRVDAGTAWRSSLFPLAGIANRPTVFLCREDGRYHRYTSDEHGFANPGSSWAGSHDIVLIGDSFTHGYCVDADSSYAGRVRTRWPSVLNLGTAGSGPLAELATLTEYAEPLHPRLVVWQYFDNDLRDLILERLHAPLFSYRERRFSQGLIARQPELDAAIGPWIEQLLTGGHGRDVTDPFRWRQVLTLFRLRDLVGALIRHRHERDQTFAQLPLFSEILGEAAARVRAWGGQMYFVAVPEWERYYRPAAEAGNIRDSVLSVARSLALPIVDLEPLVRTHPRRAELYARQELGRAHFSPLGYELMAREVIRAIEAGAKK